MNSKYEVGYGKPPKKTQFRKGKSGNVKGRPKKETRNRILFGNILNAPLDVEWNGEKVKMQPYEISIRRVLKRAVEKKRPKDIIYLIKTFEDHGLLFSDTNSGRGALFKKPDGTIIKMELTENG